ncbi:MAG: fructosamine kinase family protein [Chitinophagaceae bacterium]
MSLSATTVDFLRQELSARLNRPIPAVRAEPVSGGSINHTYRLSTGGQDSFFLKCNDALRYPDLFEKEKNGLQHVAAQDCIAVPSVIFCGIQGQHQLLVLEWIEPGRTNPAFWQRFGEQLARLHRCTSGQFGYGEDNYMGALPQLNSPSAGWTEFFVRCRLEPQVRLAVDKKLLAHTTTRSFEQLYARLDNRFTTEPPALLHGDLWSGNFLCSEQSEPVLADPAIYYGHRSMDLAMTTLFGGFDNIFYEAYHYHFPLPPDHREQWMLCNLYPLLIHLNLFGTGYLPDILATLKKFV